MGEEMMADAEFHGSLDALKAKYVLLNVGRQTDTEPEYRMQRKKAADTNTAHIFIYPIGTDTFEFMGRVDVYVPTSGPLVLKVWARRHEWDRIRPAWERLKAEIDRHNAQVWSGQVPSVSSAPTPTKSKKKDVFKKEKEAGIRTDVKEAKRLIRVDKWTKKEVAKKFKISVRTLDNRLNKYG